jgi:predicted nucleic acid-binding protein
VRYILDTCVISELIKRKPDKHVVNWVGNCLEETLFLSVLTIGEIQKGIARHAEEGRKSSLQLWLDSQLRERFEERILAVTEEVALTWGIIQGEAELKGRSIPTIDGLLGATAICHNMTIATRNEKDLRNTGARIFNPWNL